MGKVDPSQLLSWSDALSVGALIFVAIVFMISIMVVKKPRTFWPILIIAGILGCGPRLKGYFLYDEIISISAVLGALMRICISNHKTAHVTKMSSHFKVFSLWIIYMVMQSIIGILYNDDIRIVRWLIFYVLLGIIALITYYRDKEFPFPSSRNISLLVVITTLGLYVAYLGQGVFFENILGEHGRFLSQDMFWAGSAYAVFPTLLAFPASLFLLYDDNIRIRILALVSILTMMVVASYYDSRILWLVMIGYLFVHLPKMKVKTIVLLLAAFFIVFSVFNPEPIKNLSEFGEDLIETSGALWSPGKSDINRNLQLRAGFMRVSDNIKSFLIGDGIYSHRYTIIPYIEELYREYLPVDATSTNIPGSRDDTNGSLTIFRTVGFTALLIDTGVIGMFLFVINFIIVALKILKRSTVNNHIFLLMNLMPLAWLLSNNITDITLLYLLIIPYGLIERWRYEQWRQKYL